jgi:hypothetical protein
MRCRIWPKIAANRLLPPLVTRRSAHDGSRESFGEGSSLAGNLKIDPIDHAIGVHAAVFERVGLEPLTVQPLPHFRHADCHLAAFEPDLHAVKQCSSPVVVDETRSN